ncbi:tRNA (adenosine(37)-N6)-dimethylallyltransferase MiaA [Candidatus Peregrinibacteria bacterium]|nr:MAG: tRNA (adenosine(37)-N6)-dimethylallyltransferase MiaA [Candidatus Peregrinibacteria bacterium]
MKSKRAPAPYPIFSETEISLQIETFLKMKSSPLLIITGPTGSGKTSVSIRIAKQFSGEIINADSRQFYAGCDIGTAKITEHEMEGIPHHLLSFLHPNEDYPVAFFQKKAEEIISKIHSQKKLPILVGGSGLFIDAVRKGFSIPPVSPQFDIRKELEQCSTESLFALLSQNDPVLSARIDPKNRLRMIRALEVFRTTGKPISSLQKKVQPIWNEFLLGVWCETDILEQRIAERTEKMWREGFLDEVRQLLSQGYQESDPAFIAHGYREAVSFLCGKLTEEEAKSLMTRNTRRYAKRQRSWWRKEKDVVWMDPCSEVII